MRTRPLRAFALLAGVAALFLLPSTAAGGHHHHHAKTKKAEEEAPAQPEPVEAPAVRAPVLDAVPPAVGLVFADGDSVQLAEDDPRVRTFRAAAAALLEHTAS